MSTSTHRRPSTSHASATPLDRRTLELAVERGLVSTLQASQLLGDLAERPGAHDLLVAAGFERGVVGGIDAQAHDDLVPGYRVVAELGRGAMGVVYRATQRCLARDVALKVVRREEDDSSTDLPPEAAALARLNHPNVVQVHDVGDHGRWRWIALELVPGVDAASLVRARTRLSPREALVIALDAARGLRHAHEAGLIHRDVKPANLLVVEQAGDPPWIAKVADLGLARRTGGVPGDVAATHPGMFIGSPAYAAPEQALGAPVDFRADVYALGATLYHLLVGHPPFRGTSVMDLLLQKETGSATPVGAVVDVPPGLDDVLDRMLARRPDDRQASWNEVVEDLERLLAGSAPRATAVAWSSSSFARPKPTRRRSRGRLAAVALAVAFTGALLAASTSWSRGAVTPPARSSMIPPVSPRRPDALSELASLPPEARLDRARLLAVSEKGDASRDQLASLVSAALDRCIPSLSASLEEAFASGDPFQVAVLTSDLEVFHELARRDLPPRALTLAGWSARGSAAITERKALTEARAAFGEGPVRGAVALEAFLVRFPWSPDRGAVAADLAAAASVAPRLEVVTADAAEVSIDGVPVGRGTWRGRVAAGEREVVVQVPGQAVRRTSTLVVTDGAQVVLHPWPTPTRALVLDPTREAPAWNPRRSVPTQWTLEAGEWRGAPERAALVGSAPTKVWATALLDLTRAISRLGPDLGGTRIVWILDPAPQGEAEVRLLLDATGGCVAVGVEGGEVYVIRRGADDRTVTLVRRRPSRAVDGAIALRADWDGGVLEISEDGATHLASVDASGASLGEVRFAIRGGEFSLRDLAVRGLRAARRPQSDTQKQDHDEE